MPVFATAGATVAIGPAMAASYGAPMVLSTFTAVDADDWKKISPLESLGSFGDSAEEVSFVAVDIDSRVRKIKGARDAGTMELVAGLNYADPGQLAMLAAEATPNSYAFRVTFNDAPVGGTPSERFFVGIVMSASEQLDGANSVMKVNFKVAIQSNVVRKAAASA